MAARAELAVHRRRLPQHRPATASTPSASGQRVRRPRSVLSVEVEALLQARVCGDEAGGCGLH
jgi:hypothetical protein